MASSFRTVVRLQIGGIVAGLALLAFAPAPSGRYLLMPVTRAAETHMLPIALGRGARLIGTGPWRGSYVVTGARSALWRSLLRAGILMIAAPRAGCGTNGARG